ncbi:MAG TPA: SRPBCC domain-containing protein [Rhizomicrobium sp.]|jgi:uncharacterized protein YndB with AHSA1/START domain
MTVHAGSVENFASADGVLCIATLAASRDKVFAAFRHDILHWWPREETWSGATLEDIYLEGRKGGVLWERGPGGFRLDMARVMRWVAPERIILRWHIGPGRVPEPDPAKASDVEIRFLPAEAGGTRIEIEHRHFSRHGAGGDAYRAQMGSERGWPRILRCFVEHCEPTAVAAPAAVIFPVPGQVPEFVA